MKTLLLVEDDFHIQEIYRMSFVKTGNYSVETASDGQEALVKLSSHVYDLILLDIMLPKVTGIDVLRAMRAPTSPTKNTPIILITNLGQEDIIKEAFKIGADGYLIKAQFTPMDVVREVDAFFQQMADLQNQSAAPAAAEPVASPAPAPADITPAVPPQVQPVTPPPSSPATAPSPDKPQ
ncbi:MAG: Sensor protein [Candidatus Gottesmanbacteria bacterium GW2011_GWA2_43_14]|uniref:Sensor protein n=1 Tax=Candidatus Gottesmanbacteria bacterium GW2011_GWA2_43_14 TaxID=1618443 RepID=A0A0G1DJZ7_9BACT|nr:MAG: Sensor protein [Candidatus Gottesmanbacteria bacterium GW2011_GWA2_43_14]